MPGEQLMSPSTSRLSLYATTFMVGVVVISLGPLLDWSGPRNEYHLKC